MSQVLGTGESFKCKTVQKFSLTHNPMDWLQHKPCLALKIQRKIVQLRNPLFNLEHIVKSFHLVFKPLAHALLVQRPQFFINSTPQVGLFLSVFNFRDLVMNFVSQSYFGDLISSFSVLWIGELQMISVDLIFDLKKGFSQLIDVLLAFGEPWDLDWVWEISMNSNCLELSDKGGHFILGDFLDGHKDGVLFFEIGRKVFKVCFYVSHVDFVSGEDAC
jgi:hypothetical protein